jgi:hypothetical protein
VQNIESASIKIKSVAGISILENTSIGLVFSNISQPEPNIWYGGTMG